MLNKAIEDSLGIACVRGLKSRQFQIMITDAFQQRSLSGGMILAVSWCLAKWLKQYVHDSRIGIVLPPGIGATVTNLACVLADKVPVNFNFTMGRKANELCMELSEITTVISTDIMIKKAKDFPWPEKKNLIDVKTQLLKIGKIKIFLQRFMVFVQSSQQIVKSLNLSEKGGSREGGVLFTSGSSGNPKGVVLTHRNIVANVYQVQEIFPRELASSIMGCLPIFHSFGFTVTLFWPLICGPRVITYISPLDSSKIIAAVEKYEVELLVSTPTFLRSYTRKGKLEQLKSLRLVVVGAEKLPRQVMEDFENKMKIPVCEGYGMTETSPVISANRPNTKTPKIDIGKDSQYRRIGSTGQVLPEIEVKVTHPETNEQINPTETGLLWFKGPNVFEGYLKNEKKSKEVLKNGWYCSGDLGYVDKDGFLYIEGRLSRFSKIGGEMVPHGTVEQKLSKIFTEILSEDAHVVVMGIRDDVKGEILIGLTTKSVPKTDWQKLFKQQGLPNLWMPKEIFEISEIPQLASGKLDLKGCQEMVENFALT